jgi:hypothetical protein
MKLYKDIGDFIIEAFPLEYEKLIKRSKTPIEKRIESIDRGFDQDLKEIMTGADLKKK